MMHLRPVAGTFLWPLWSRHNCKIARRGAGYVCAIRRAGAPRTVKQALTGGAQTPPSRLRSCLFRSRQRKLIATVVGVLLAGLPLAAFDLWLEQLVDRQSSEDIFSNARRTIQLIDTRLTEVAAALDGLAAQGVSSCGPADLEKLRRAALATSPAKEIAIIAPNGQMVCSDLGIPLSARVVAGPIRTAPP